MMFSFVPTLLLRGLRQVRLDCRLGLGGESECAFQCHSFRSFSTFVMRSSLTGGRKRPEGRLDTAGPLSQDVSHSDSSRLLQVDERHPLRSPHVSVSEKRRRPS